MIGGSRAGCGEPGTGTFGGPRAERTTERSGVVLSPLETKFLRFETRQEQDSVLWAATARRPASCPGALDRKSEPPPHERGPGQCRLNTSDADARAGVSAVKGRSRIPVQIRPFSRFRILPPD